MRAHSVIAGFAQRCTLSVLLPAVLVSTMGAMPRAHRYPIASPSHTLRPAAKTLKGRTRFTDCNDNSEIIAPCTSTKSAKIGGQFSVLYTFTNNNFENIPIAPRIRFLRAPLTEVRSMSQRVLIRK